LIIGVQNALTLIINHDKSQGVMLRWQCQKSQPRRCPNADYHILWTPDGDIYYQMPTVLLASPPRLCETFKGILTRSTRLIKARATFKSIPSQSYRNVTMGYAATKGVAAVLRAQLDARGPQKRGRSGTGGVRKRLWTGAALLMEARRRAQRAGVEKTAGGDGRRRPTGVKATAAKKQLDILGRLKNRRL
jgi:hypothetical protein